MFELQTFIDNYQYSRSLSNLLETFFSEGNYKIPSLQEYIIQQLSQSVFMFWHVNILTSYLLSFTY